jgi:ethanolamine-phosphate phospho-lyase
MVPLGYSVLLLLAPKGKGARLWDENGVSYLDTRNNVAHCGHCHPRIVEAVQQQVATLNTNTRYLHPTVCELAQRLVESLANAVSNDATSASPLDTVFFCNSGSEANDLALRLARAWSKGSLNTIVVDRAYHGHTLATLEVSPYKYETKEYSHMRKNHHQNHAPTLPPQSTDSLASPSAATPGRHIWKVPCPDTFRGPYKDVSTAGKQYAAHVQEACRYYRDELGESVRALILEGGMSVAGVVLPPPGYIRASVEAVRAAGGLYIADEVQTGFGRLGSCFWAFCYQHDTATGSSNGTQTTSSAMDDIVMPDIVTVGKAFGNGMPLAAVVTSRKIARVFESCQVEYFNTFGGNPVSAAAGLAVMDVIREEKLPEKALKVGSYMLEQFRALQESIECIGDVRGSGFFIGIEFVENKATLAPASTLTSWLCSQLKVVYQVLTSIDGPYNNVLVIKPPMVFSKDDADYFILSLNLALTRDLPSIQDTLPEMTKTPT